MDQIVIDSAVVIALVNNNKYEITMYFIYIILLNLMAIYCVLSIEKLLSMPMQQISSSLTQPPGGPSIIKDGDN